MARAATAGELTKFRADGSFSQLYLAIHQPAVVMSCRVNQTFSSTDDISQVTYDGVTTGAYTDVIPGMTVYVGSSAGAYDLGMVRVRKNPTSSVLYIGKTSEIAWADNLYLMVVNEFGLWAKHWHTPTETAVFMDQEIAYTDQNANLDPCPVLGPDAVLWLSGATVNFTPTAAASWVIGSSISSYSWSAPGASATASLTTATPTITYNAAGTYRVSCTVTAANGKSFTGYRTVFVFTAASMPVTAFQLESCEGDAEQGGWSFTVRMQDQAALATVRERTKVVLFAKDWYGSTEGSIGPISGYENIIASGWIDEESIDWDAEGSVRFTVRGPAYWLSKLAALPGGLKSTSSTPTEWRSTQSLTVDKAMHNICHWRSTIDAVMDVTLTSDTDTAPNLMAAPGSIWGQLAEISGWILAAPRCDRYGRLFVEVDTEYLPTASRASIPVVQEITKVDWAEQIHIPRKAAGELAKLESSAVGATEDDRYYSAAYGQVPGLYGTIETKDQLLAADQADLNLMTGMLVAKRNNPYPVIDISLAANNRLVDICPRQYLTLSIASGDTKRGITWTSKKLIARRVSFVWNSKTGALSTDLECEAETIGTAGQTALPPQPPQNNFPPVTPIGGDFPIVPPPDVWFPPIIPGGGELDSCRGGGGGPNGPYPLNFDTSILQGGETAYAYFPCWIRGSDAYKSEIHLFLPTELNPGLVHISAIDGSKTAILGATDTTNADEYGHIYQFQTPGGFDTVGFKLALDALGGYEPVGAALATGGITDPKHSYNETISGLDPDKVYCFQSTGGPLYYSAGPGSPDYGPVTWGSVNGGAVVSGVADPDGIHSRKYLSPNASGQILVSWADSNYDDNSGSLGWAVYEAWNSVRIYLNNVLLFNICAAAG